MVKILRKFKNLNWQNLLRVIKGKSCDHLSSYSMYMKDAGMLHLNSHCDFSSVLSTRGTVHETAATV